MIWLLILAIFVVGIALGVLYERVRTLRNTSRWSAILGKPLQEAVNKRQAAGEHLDKTMAQIIRVKTDKQRGAERIHMKNGEKGTPLSDLM